MSAAAWVRERIAVYTGNILVKRLFAVLSVDILVKLSGMLLLPVYLRLMTQNEYGLYNYLISVILTFSLVLNFGLYIPISKFYHDHSDAEDRGELLFTVFTMLSFLLAIILIPIYAFGLDYRIIDILFKNRIAYNNYRAFILLAIVAAVCNFMFTNLLYTSERIGRLQRYNIFRIIGINALSIGGLVFLRWIGDGVRIRLESTYLMEILLFLAFAYPLIREVRTRFKKELAVSSLKLALPVMVSAVFGIVINFGDKFFLEKYTSFKDLSYYYLAVSCASLIPLIFASFQNAWLPLFLKEKDLSRNVRKTNKLLARLFFIFLGLSVLMIIFLKVMLLMGIIQNKYQESLYILPIMLLSQIFSALSPLYTNYLIYLEKTYITSITGLTIGVASIALDLLLIPRYGVYGAAAASFISNLCLLVIYYFIIKVNVRKQLKPECPLFNN